MSAHGQINWWGFSPGFDMLRYVEGNELLAEDKSNTSRNKITDKIDHGIEEPSIHQLISEDSENTSQNGDETNLSNCIQASPMHQIGQNQPKLSLAGKFEHQTTCNDVRLMVVGAGDPRMLLTTLAGGKWQHLRVTVCFI